MSLRPESEQSALDIAAVEKTFPVPPRSRHGDRKTLPPLPPLAEIEREAAIAAALEDEERKSVASTSSSSRTTSPTGEIGRQMLQKALPLPFGLKKTRSDTLVISRPTPASVLPFGLQTQNLPPSRPTTGGSENTSTPLTASTKRLSFTSIDPHRNLRHGTGKHAKVVLSPQPSSDPADPLNWAPWKKQLNFAALLTMVAVTGVMKTALVSVNGTLATRLGVDYPNALVLTAVPLILSSVTGMASMIIAKIWGKRPVYVISALLVFFGTVLDIGGGRNAAQIRAARIFQGLGWGAFDTLVLGSILDTYFEHERESKITLYNAVSMATTWGAPLIGGAASMRPGGISVQFEILTPFVFIALLLVVFGAPETSYSRSSFLGDEKRSSYPPIMSLTQMFPNMTLSKDAVSKYIKNVTAWPYRVVLIDQGLITQAPKAAAAPSTLLLFSMTLLPLASLWGVTSSLSNLFGPGTPSALSESSIGAVFAGPFILAFTAAAGLPMLISQNSLRSGMSNKKRSRNQLSRQFPRASHLVVIAVGTTLSAAGLLGFGLYITDSAVRPAQGDTAIWDLTFRSGGLSFALLSFLLGLLAAGHATLDTTIRPAVRESTAFTSANMGVALRNTADMQGGLACLRAFVVGLFVIGLPSALATWDGLRAAAVGLAAVQILVAGIVAAVYVWCGQFVMRWDGSFMGLVDLKSLKSRGSFFDDD